MVLFYNILDVSGMNAFIIWTQLKLDWQKNKTHRRRLFLKQLGKDLVEEHMRSRLALPGLSVKLRNTIEECVRDVNQSDNMEDVRHDCENSWRADGAAPISGKRCRGRCALCDRSKDKKTRVTCSKCNAFACADHVVMLCKGCIV